MTTALKWRTAFREIYGRNPTKNDYSVAPSYVKEEYFGDCAPSTSSTVCTGPRKLRVCLKRPRPEDEDSPVRKPSKFRRLCENTDSMGTPTTLRKRSRDPTRSCDLSQVKCGKILNSASKNEDSALEKVKSTSSPAKTIKESENRITTLPTFTSLFDTPEKGKPAAWGEITPQKDMIHSRTSGKSPLRSPRKPLLHKEILVKNAECLLLPTPEKREQNGIVEPFKPEELPAKKCRVSSKNATVAFCPENGRVVKRALKRHITGSTTRSKRLEGNYVKINIKKKLFSRGKVSAEQKRKMRRKQNWRKRIVNGGGSGMV